MSVPTQGHLNAANSWMDEWLLTEDNSELVGVESIPGGAVEDTRATFIFTPENDRAKSVNAPRKKTVDYKRINLSYLENEHFTTPTNTGSIVTQLIASGLDITADDVIAANVVVAQSTGSLVVAASPTSLLYVGSANLSTTNLNW